MRNFMDFEYFSLSRDLVYLAAVFTGLASGSFLSMLRGYTTIKRQNLLISRGLLLLSAGVAGFAAAILLSRGRIVQEPLLLPALAVFVVVTLAYCFPRCAAFPLVLLTGLVVVWLGYSFLRFPQAEAGPLAFIRREGPARYTIRLAGTDQPVFSGINDTPPLEIEGSLAVAGRLYPVIGGQTRVQISRIHSGGSLLFDATAENRPSLRGGAGLNRFGITSVSYKETFPVDLLPLGAETPVLLGDRGLSFDAKEIARLPAGALRALDRPGAKTHSKP